MLFHELAWPALQKLPRSTPVVVPIAAVEQHGHHLPVFTDSLLLGEIVRRVEATLKDEVLFLPLQWLGNSDHHLDFGGTISAPPRVYLDVLNGVVENLLSAGFTRILLLNGHGGNDVPGKQAIFEVRQRHRLRNDLLLLFSTYWSLGAKPWEHDPSIVQHDMGHACEWETSMILRIRPELVGDYKNAPEVPPGESFRPAYRAWITKDRSEPGHIGVPSKASVEKGELIFQLFSEDVCGLLRRMLTWQGHWDA